LLWISAGLLGGLVAGFLFALSFDSGSTRSTLILPSPSLAHAAQGGGSAIISVADVAEQSLPSVVNISITPKAKAHQSPMFRDPFFREFFRHFNPRGAPPPRRERSLGSGVIVSADGIVITNNHVVAKASKIRVILSDKREFRAKVVGTDPKSDLAVLRLKGAKNLKPIKLGDSDKLRLGDVVLAIGNPFGVGQTVTMGIVSAKGRANMGIVDYEDFIQTDAAINPGNSGGAMINMHGELVGINTAILSRSGGYQGIGFAIPSNMVRPIMKSLLKRGKVIRGWLGVVIQDVTRDLVQAMKLSTKSGVLISDVDRSGPAYKAGLKRGDVVVKLNGKKVSSTGRLRNLVASAGAGAKVKLEFYRKGSLKTLRVKLAELPGKLGAASSYSGAEGGVLDLSVGPLNRDNRRAFNIPARVKYGVVVESVGRNSAASVAGIKPGDVILEVNRAKITSVRRFSQSLHAAKDQVLLLIYRQGSTMFMILNKDK
jgi:serine protease Do